MVEEVEQRYFLVGRRAQRLAVSVRRGRGLQRRRERREFVNTRPTNRQVRRSALRLSLDLRQGGAGSITRSRALATLANRVERPEDLRRIEQLLLIAEQRI